MRMKIKIAELAGKHNLKSAYALQKALDISPTMAARLWKGEFDKIGINTMEKLCDYFYCQPNDFLEYPLTLSGKTQSSNETQSSNTESSKNVERATQLSNTESSKTEKASDNESGGESDKYNLTSADAGRFLDLSPRTVREYAEKGTLKGKQGKQNHWFFRRSDIVDFIAQREAE